VISLAGSLLKLRGLKTERLMEAEATRGTTLVKRGFAHMLKHGVVVETLYGNVYSTLEV